MREKINITWLQQMDRKGQAKPDAALVSIGPDPLTNWSSWSFADYTMGISNPHYPVPAIGNLMPLANPVVLYGIAHDLWAK